MRALSLGRTYLPRPIREVARDRGALGNKHQGARCGVCTFNPSAGEAEALCRAGNGCVIQAAEVAQWLKALVAKPDDLRSI